jgi:hypothetical protein
MGMACSTHGAKRNAYTIRIVVGNLEGRRPPKRSRCRWEDVIKNDHRQIGCGGVGSIDVAQDRDQ